jgi:hypothetical protein
MTQVLNDTRRVQTPQAAADRREAERVLRDVAVVLHLTRRVRTELLRERKESPRLLATAA